MKIRNKLHLAVVPIATIVTTLSLFPLATGNNDNVSCFQRTHALVREAGESTTSPSTPVTPPTTGDTGSGSGSGSTTPTPTPTPTPPAPPAPVPPTGPEITHAPTTVNPR